MITWSQRTSLWSCAESEPFPAEATIQPTPGLVSRVIKPAHGGCGENERLEVHQRAFLFPSFHSVTQAVSWISPLLPNLSRVNPPPLCARSSKPRTEPKTRVHGRQILLKVIQTDRGQHFTTVTAAHPTFISSVSCAASGSINWSLPRLRAQRQQNRIRTGLNWTSETEGSRSDEEENSCQDWDWWQRRAQTQDLLFIQSINWWINVWTCKW